MLPNDDQVRRAAYELWKRRGRVHGLDREDWHAAERELVFSMNYQTIVEYSLDAPGLLVLRGRPTRYCRFCERTPVQAAFSASHAVVAGIGPTSLYTEEVCDQCQETCREPRVALFTHFWNALTAALSDQASADQVLSSDLYSLDVMKSLIASALLIMPEGELSYFVDTLEWVNNPYRHDDPLFAESVCHVYFAPFLAEKSWCALARRSDHDIPLPYMIYFLSRGGLVAQVQVPLSLRDLDLDGRRVIMPERSLTQGKGGDFQQARSVVLRLPSPRIRAQTGNRPAFPPLT
jgi:hypothetical protein